MLAHDDRALTLLVHGEGHSRVARVFAPTIDPVIVEQELAVLECVASGSAALRHHVVALDDLFTLADGRVVALLEPVTGCGLGDVVRRGSGTLEVGEAITVLAPLFQAVTAGHERGLTGLPMTPSRIRFTPTGAPVVVSVEGARLTPPLPVHYRAIEADYRNDWRALAALAQEVVHAVRPDAASALQAMVAAWGPELDPTTAAAELFDLATPIPLRFEERAVRAEAAEPSASTHLLDVAGAHPRAASEPSTPAPSSGVVTSTLRALAVPESVIHAVERARAVVIGGAMTGRAAVVAWAAKRRGSIPHRRRLRPQYVLTGAAGAGSLLLAASLGMATPDRADSTGSSFAESAAAEASGGQTSAAEPTDGRFPPSPVVADSDAPERLVHPDPDEWALVVGAVVDRWVACRAAIEFKPDGGAPGGTCDVVVHVGSAAEDLLAVDDDRHAVLANWIVTGGSAVVVERMGGAVLIDLVVAPDDSSGSAWPGDEAAAATTAASLLLVRSEAGWRVRDVRL